MFTRIARGGDFAFYATVAETTRDQDSIQILQDFYTTCFNILRIDQFDVDGNTVFQAAMLQRFNHRFVGIRQLNVLADHTDGDFT